MTNNDHREAIRRGPASDTPFPFRVKGYRIQAGDVVEPFVVANCWSGPFAPTREAARQNAEYLVAAANLAPTLLAEVERLKGLLIRLQWMAYDDRTKQAYCLICRATLTVGHKPDCELSRALADGEGRKEGSS